MFRQDGESVGFFCISKSGHDAGEYYVIVSAAGNGQGAKASNFVWVANGLNKTFQAPKKKNPAHLYITKTRVAEFDKLSNGEPVSSNLKLAELIKKHKIKERSVK